MVRIGIGQMSPVIGDTRSNLKILDRLLYEAERAEVNVLVLPELANSGYAFETGEEAAASAEVIPEGPFSSRLADWSSRGLVISGICETDGDDLYNSAAVFADGDYIVTYRKVHLFNREKLFFKPGDKEPPVIEYGGHRYGLMICWDWVFPEMARILALKGAQVILHPANLVLPYCHRAMVTRSIENGVFTVTANRTGTERGLKFYGESQVVSPRGEVLLKMSGDETAVRWVDVNPADADDKMLTERNHLLRDRRPAIYRRLVEE